MIDELTIRRVKDASNIVDVVRDFYKLRRDGNDGTWTCLCPFHEDRHLGSFKVSERKNIYTCFSCGAHGGPIEFLMEHEKLTFPDAIRWLGKKYCIEVEGQERIERQMQQCKPHTPPPPLPMLTISLDTMKNTMHLSGNILIDWLKSLTWTEEQHARIPQILTNYAIGQSKGGHTIFWQIDEQGRVRTGKMMKYKPDGHRDKESAHNFDWIHSLLARNGAYNPNQMQCETCLFGLHLMNMAPMATVNIVESEKTALIMAIAYGGMKNHIWMATGGMQFLTPLKLKPLIDAGRDIILYPDHDGEEKWKEHAAAMAYDKLYVNTSFMRDYWKPEDGEKADVADIITRMIKPDKPTLDEVIGRYPQLAQMHQKLGLEVINETKLQS